MGQPMGTRPCVVSFSSWQGQGLGERDWLERGRRRARRCVLCCVCLSQTLRASRKGLEASLEKKPCLGTALCRAAGGVASERLRSLGDALV